MKRIQVVCRKCTRIKGRYPWNEGYWYGWWMWIKINVFKSPKVLKPVKKVRILCRKCKPFTFD